MASTTPCAIVIPSRPVIAEPIVISSTQFAYTFPAAPTFSHIVVFLLPGIVLPADSVAAIYLQLPQSLSSSGSLLGYLSSAKQSAIFKVNGIDKTKSFDNGSVPEVSVGISIEPMSSVQNPNPTAGGAGSVDAGRGDGSSTLSTKVLAQRIIKNAFDFLAGFTASAGGTEVVPLKSFQDWWTKFERRIELDPGFLERQE